MSEFDELYQEIILDHYRSPRGAAVLDHVPDSLLHENPTCGDSIKIEITWHGNGTIAAVRFENRGCAISTASASMLTELVRDLAPGVARDLAARFIDALNGTGADDSLDDMGDLVAFRGVRAFPARVKCATLAWHAFVDALDSAGGVS
ncbi:MAG TPA: SUF system NifU family Fe-S cluster assembly protein [Rectinemataceae bacterium]|nr:SUF system NifU family Fe-S cluster assembly protein [Rectinemataceae bacterium]